MDKANIKLQHYGDGVNVAWYWTDEAGKTISPYMDDSDVAERWGELYREAVRSGIIHVNGVTYSAKK